MNHREFLANIAQHPADMFPREVYAEWLEERGDVRAEFIRMSIELAEREPKLPRLLKARSMNIPASSVSIRDEQTGQYRLRTPALHEPIRFEIITEDMPSEIGSLVEVFAGGKSPAWIDAIVLDRASTAYEGRNVEYDVRLQLREIHGEPLPERQEIRELSDRCAALLAEHRREWTMAGLKGRCIYVREGLDFIDDLKNMDDLLKLDPAIKVDFARGFPEILTLRWEEWQRHYRTLIDAMPVREVRLTSRPVETAEAVNGSSESGRFVVCGQMVQISLADLGKGWLPLITARFPGHDPAHPIKYTLPVDQRRLPRGIDPRGVMTGNEAISVTVPTIFPTPTINIGGIP